MTSVGACWMSRGVAKQIRVSSSCRRKFFPWRSAKALRRPRCRSMNVVNRAPRVGDVIWLHSRSAVWSNATSAGSKSASAPRSRVSSSARRRCWCRLPAGRMLLMKPIRDGLRNLMGVWAVCRWGGWVFQPELTQRHILQGEGKSSRDLRRCDEFDEPYQRDSFPPPGLQCD